MALFLAFVVLAVATDVDVGPPVAWFGGGAGLWALVRARPVASQPVVGVPAGWAPPEGAVAEVVGEPREGAVVLGRVGGVELHLAGSCRTDVASGRAPGPPTAPVG